MEVVKEDCVKEEVPNFYQALAAAMSEIPMFEKKNKVSFGKTNYSYIKLEEINAVVKPILQKHGLFITHKVENGFLTTSIVHIDSKDGITSHFKIDSNDPQKIGSLMTYGRRYNICALLNIDCAGEDDDCVQLYNTKKEVTKNVQDNKAELIERISNRVDTFEQDRAAKFWNHVNNTLKVDSLDELDLKQLQTLYSIAK